MSRMRSIGKNAGMLGAAVGVVAAGAAIGFAAERYAVGRSFRKQPPAAGPPEPYGSLRGEERAVRADDGIELHVEIDGRADTPLTVVFCHGWSLTQDSWHYQRRDLRDVGRLVFWDLRGHGRSGRGAPETAHIEQLGNDLRALLQEVTPRGPVVLVGHSMGGMTIMALADAHPELFGEIVVGVALIGTSSGKLSDVTLGLPWFAGKVLGRLRPRVFDAVSRRAELVERGKRAGSDLAYVLTKKFSFASDVPIDLVCFAQRMIESTPIDVVADFYPALHSHDKLAALPVLDNVEALVMVGENDLLTPADHSRAMADAIKGCELVVVPEGGHLAFLEHPDVFNYHLRELCRRAARRARAAEGAAMEGRAAVEGPAA